MAGESVQLPVLRQGLTAGNVDQYNYEEIHKSLDHIDPYPLDAAAATYGNAREAFAKSQSRIVDCATKLAGAWSGDSADEAWRQLSQLHDAANVLATHSDTMQSALYATSGAIAAGKADMQSTYQPSTDTTGYSAAVASPGLANRKAQLDAQARKQLAQINSDVHNNISKAPSNITFTLPNRREGDSFGGQPTGSGGGGPSGTGDSSPLPGQNGQIQGGLGSPHNGGGSRLQGDLSGGTGGFGPGVGPGRGLGGGGSPGPGDSPGYGAPQGGGWMGATSGLGPEAAGNGLSGHVLGGGFDRAGAESGLNRGGIAGTAGAAAENGTLGGRLADARDAMAIENGVLSRPSGAGAMGMPILGGPAGVEVNGERKSSPWLFGDADVWADQGDVAPPVIG